MVVENERAVCGGVGGLDGSRAVVPYTCCDLPSLLLLPGHSGGVSGGQAALHTPGPAHGPHPAAGHAHPGALEDRQQDDGSHTGHRVRAVRVPSAGAGEGRPAAQPAHQEQ